MVSTQRFSNCVARPRGRCWPLVGRECLYEGHIHFNEMWEQDKMYILVGTLLGSSISLIT
jgi:hypothetical protein